MFRILGLDCGYSTGFRGADGSLTVNTTRYPHGTQLVPTHSERTIVNHERGIHSDISRGFATFKTHDARRVWQNHYSQHSGCRSDSLSLGVTTRAAAFAASGPGPHQEQEHTRVQHQLSR